MNLKSDEKISKKLFLYINTKADDVMLKYKTTRVEVRYSIEQQPQTALDF